MEEQYRSVLPKLFTVALMVGLMLCFIFYLNQRWERIRDIRRQGDLLSITKALEFYNQHYNQYPDNFDDDGEGWDKSNDLENRSFLEPLIKAGLLSITPFDPKNDVEHYYRYQKFASGDYGCVRPSAIFQVTQFEAEVLNHGQGDCPGLKFSELAPAGYTWQGIE